MCSSKKKKKKTKKKKKKKKRKEKLEKCKEFVLMGLAVPDVVTTRCPLPPPPKLRINR